MHAICHENARPSPSTWMPEVLLNVACTVRPDCGSGITTARIACLAIAMNLTGRARHLTAGNTTDLAFTRAPPKQTTIRNHALLHGQKFVVCHIRLQKHRFLSRSICHCTPGVNNRSLVLGHLRLHVRTHCLRAPNGTRLQEHLDSSGPCWRSRQRCVWASWQLT